MLRNIWRNSFLVVIMTSLVGCGFHLRGADHYGELPFHTAVITTSPGVSHEVKTALALQLHQSGIQILDTQAADVQIVLMATKITSTSTSSGLGDRTSELLKFTQAFKVTDLVTGKLIVGGDSVVYRDRKINISDALASNSELQSIRKSMSQKIARQIVERIHRALAYEQTDKAVVGQ